MFLYKLLISQKEINVSMKIVFVEKVGQKDIANEILEKHYPIEWFSNIFETVEDLQEEEKEYIIAKSIYDDVSKIAEQRKKELCAYVVSFDCIVDDMNCKKKIDFDDIFEDYEYSHGSYLKERYKEYINNTIENALEIALDEIKDNLNDEFEFDKKIYNLWISGKTELTPHCEYLISVALDKLLF